MNDTKKHTIVVTGGLGFIGSHTVIDLLENNFDVIILDDLSNSTYDMYQRIKKISGKSPIFKQINICNLSAFQEALSDYNQIDGIIHFAAYKSVSDSVKHPLKYYANNLNGMINVLKIQEIYSIPNLIFSSSCTVYGQPDHTPVSEESPVKPAESPYGHTKQICEKMIQQFIQQHPNKNALALRYFNPAGAHPSTLIGELPNGTPENLVPYITQTAIGIRPILNVFGNDYSTPDGTCIRDYIHIVDLAKAHVAALNYLLSKKNKLNFDVINLGTGNGFSVLDVIHSFEKISGQKLNYQIAPRRPGDIEQIWANPTKANQLLNWKTELSLDDMMRSAWEWEKVRNER